MDFPAAIMIISRWNRLPKISKIYTILLFPQFHSYRNTFFINDNTFNLIDYFGVSAKVMDT